MSKSNVDVRNSVPDASASQAHQNANSLTQKLSEIRREREPEKDLWPGIEFAIISDKQKQQQDNHASRLQGAKATKSRRVYLAAAASVCLLVLIANMGFEYMAQHNTQSLIAKLSAEHQQQKQALLISVQDAVPATNNWQQQLADLDEAERAIKQALDEAPNNPALIKMLKHVYQQQLAIIERVHAPAWQQI
ncbi:hypothetical protein ACFO4O_14595 [Glaciecola siphonariae]|uniref:Uncharacterized protein n=1 Tax=Glaciecola siphonariae TaxID=521012 RepID=A0ABV9M0G0_9ALTE